MSLRAASCLEDQLSEYAAGRLSAEHARRFDLHLVACDSCCRRVAAERRLQAVLSDTSPQLPDRLRSSLLAMAASVPVQSPDGPVVPPVPVAPFRFATATPTALPVIQPSAPALHRSALRSAMMATVVAGASAAAVWSLGITGGAAANATTGGGRPAAPTIAPTGGALGGLGGVRGPSGVGGPAVSVAYRWQWGLTAVTTESSLGAESTP